MKKILANLILIIIVLLFLLVATLSTIGIQTNKFNKLISDKISQTKNINLSLNTIKFKLNPKELSLFLETQNPKITFREINIPTQNIKVFIDFISILKSKPKIESVTLILKELDIIQLNELSKIIKPSNFKSMLTNKIKKGKLISEIEIFFSKQGTIENFITRGTIESLDMELFDSLIFTNTNLGFFADKNDILIKNIFGDLNDLKISDGDIKINLENGIKINSNFETAIDLNKNLLKKYTKFIDKNEFIRTLDYLKADFNNSLSITLDKTYKVEEFTYNILGVVKNTKFVLKNSFKNNFLEKEIKDIYFSNFQIDMNFSPDIIKFKGVGQYSFNNLDFFKINLDNKINKDKLNLLLNLDFGENFQLDLINYKKTNKTIADISLNFEKNKDEIKINKFQFLDGKNSIQLEKFNFKENKFLSFKKVLVVTPNNNFSIKNEKKIFIKGSKFDATNLVKFFNNRSNENRLKSLNSDIEIDFQNIKVPMSEQLKNFKLIGTIKEGQFIKILSKGDFGGNNFLDISMKRNKNTQKKYLEIYSDLPRPLLTEFSFFKGLSGGKLLFTSIIDDSSSNSKLKIENFKLINAPGVIKLLSLADLRGLVDLAEGDGLSFDVLEIDMEKNNNFLKLNEIIALGPSMSVLMDGYQDENKLTSLRGTLVPAKTLNKIIAKIPVIGNIVIPKEIGEGLFGISFKMKGPKGKIKTTINPIRTLTPRFIQKIIDRNKIVK